MERRRGKKKQQTRREERGAKERRKERTERGQERDRSAWPIPVLCVVMY